MRWAAAPMPIFVGIPQVFNIVDEPAREEGGGAAGGGDSFNRGELRVGVELDAPFSREENPRSELWLFLPPSRSLTLLSTPLHFHGFGVDARLPRIDGGSAGGGRERGTRSFVHRLMAVPFETH